MGAPDALSGIAGMACCGSPTRHNVVWFTLAGKAEHELLQADLLLFSVALSRTRSRTMKNKQDRRCLPRRRTAGSLFIWGRAMES